MMMMMMMMRVWRAMTTKTMMVFLSFSRLRERRTFCSTHSPVGGVLSIITLLI